jgi:hypothetical protein
MGEISAATLEFGRDRGELGREAGHVDAVPDRPDEPRFRRRSAGDTPRRWRRRTPRRGPVSHGGTGRRLGAPCGRRSRRRWARRHCAARDRAPLHMWLAREKRPRLAEPVVRGHQLRVGRRRSIAPPASAAGLVKTGARRIRRGRPERGDVGEILLGAHAEIRPRSPERAVRSRDRAGDPQLNA